MNIGIPREVRSFEYRVGLSPAGVEILCQHGHTVFVEHKAGNGAGFPDKEYEQAGAKIVYSPEEAYGRATLVLKIARPIEAELPFLQPGTILAGLLNLPSARKSKIEFLIQNNIDSGFRIDFERCQIGRSPAISVKPDLIISRTACLRNANDIVAGTLYGEREIIRCIFQ